MCKLLGHFWTNDTGATAIEYGFIAGIVSIASVVAWVSMGNSQESIFGSISTDLTNATNSMGD